ncbi:MAG: D-glycerate dehydrogenase [Alphaproteobacteria bacterium]|nr:D-glycerate dehydrogenase [Alphaproteobacteria bacterium]
MTPPRLLITRTLPDAVEQRAVATWPTRLNPDDRPLTVAELTAHPVEAILGCAVDRFDANVIQRLPPSVRVLATFSVGVDHIDLGAAKARGLIVTNTPDVLTDATADIAMLLILAACRRAGEGERLVRANQWTGWTPTQLMGIHVAGRRLGIYGMGRIGQALAHRARAFGLAIHYHNRSRLPLNQEQGAIYHPTVESLLAVSDILSLNAPATPATDRLLNAERIALLPRGAVLINTARGALVDDEAVIAALTSRHLAAAGLDVFRGEPALHPGYCTLENAVLLPHLGSATVDTRTAMGMKALDNIDAVLLGRDPPDRVV